ncbi:MAG TPA: hypothetical protein VK081_12105 [Planctomycetota bacterium]|nr:hypothetical protein [Planctomycetota bacterium]
MPLRPFTAGQHPLLPEELELTERVLAALAREGHPAAESAAKQIEWQVDTLASFGELLGRYPSPLQAQSLGDYSRDVDTLVSTLVETDQATFPFRVPTQALVGRALNIALINFFRLLWLVSGRLPGDDGAALREATAHRLRAGVHCRLVEEVLIDIVTDPALRRVLRERAARHLAHLWGNRLTWRVSAFFPILAATWEARQRVRVVGGTLVGTAEMFQLVAAGGDPEFVELLLERDHGEGEVLAFREFLFDRSSEELERLAAKMQAEGLSSIQLDSRRHGDRDAGSVLFEFFRSRLVRCAARRILDMPGPRQTAEGYVMLAWLDRE